MGAGREWAPAFAGGGEKGGGGGEEGSGGGGNFVAVSLGIGVGRRVW